MYIACPKCDAKFSVTEQQIGPEGRKVKCSECNNIWLQKVPSLNGAQVERSEKPSQISKPQPQNRPGVNLPAIVPVRIPYYLYSMQVLLVGLIIMMLSMILPTESVSWSFLTSPELSIRDVQIENKKELDRISINYKILNSGTSEKRMLLVRIRLFDKNNQLLKSYVVDDSKVILAPKQYIERRVEFAPAPHTADNIDIMIGNKLDLILR